MVKFKPLLLSLLLVVGFCIVAAPSFAKAKAKTCNFSGNYSFNFWDAYDDVAGSGYVSVSCSGYVTGGEIFCNAEEEASECIIQDGTVSLHPDGTGLMIIECDSDICGDTQVVELDISVVDKGASVVFNTNGTEYVNSGLLANSGYGEYITGRGDRTSTNTITGTYGFNFWESDDYYVGSGVISLTTTNGLGVVLNGFIRCNTDDAEYEEQITTGGFTQFGDGTGYLWFETVDEDICDWHGGMAWDFAEAKSGNELLFNCDGDPEIQGNRSLPNTGNDIACAGQALLQ